MPRKLDHYDPRQPSSQLKSAFQPPKSPWDSPTHCLFFVSGDFSSPFRGDDKWSDRFFAWDEFAYLGGVPSQSRFPTP